MNRENLENKINKLQLLKKWRNSVCPNLSRQKAYSITRWLRRHMLRTCVTSSPRCTSTSLWKALRTLISKMESYKSCWPHHCRPKKAFGKPEKSLNDCIGDLEKRTEEQNRHYRKYKTNLLNLVENKLDCKRNCNEKKKLFEIRRFVVSTEWEKWRERNYTSWWVLDEKIKRKSRDYSTAHFPIAANARTHEFYEQFWIIQDIESNCIGRLSHVASEPEMVLSSRSLLSRDKRLPLDTWDQSEAQENVFGPIFYAWFTSRCSSENFIWRRARKSRSSPWRSDDGNKQVWQERRRTKIWHNVPMPMFASRPLTTSSKHPVDFPQNYVVGQQRQHMSELQFDRFPHPSSFLVLETRFDNTGLKWFWFSVGSNVMDQRSGDGWFSGWAQILAISEGKDFPNFQMLDAKIASALNKIIQNSQFRKKVSLEEHKAPKEDWFLRGRQIAFIIHDYFRLTCAHDTA